MNDAKDGDDNASLAGPKTFLTDGNRPRDLGLSVFNLNPFDSDFASFFDSDIDSAGAVFCRCFRSRSE